MMLVKMLGNTWKYLELYENTMEMLVEICEMHEHAFSCLWECVNMHENACEICENS